MNNQMERPSGQAGHATYIDDPHMYGKDAGVQIGHNEEHGEKKSVLKKVKAKAKKIKDTIKEHVGHGHDHDDENDDDNDDVDMEPEIHGTHTAQSVIPGQEGVARQHMHEPKLGERTAGQGAQVVSKPGDYQKFDHTTARSTPGQDETLGWSRTDTGRTKEYEEQPYAPKNTPVAMHSGGHSSGDLDIGKKDAPVKLGSVVGGPIGVERDPQAPKDVGEVRHPDNYQAKVTATGYDTPVAQSFMPGQRTSKMGERAGEGVIHAPASKTQGDFQTFDPTTTSFVPRQEETLCWSRTDTGRPNRSEEMFNTSKNTPVASHSVITGHGSTAAQSFTPGLHRNNRRNGSEEMPSALKNTPVGAQSGYESHDSMAAQSFMPGLHRSKVGERTAMEGVVHAPESKPLGDYQTFDPNFTSNVPEQEETLGWSRTGTPGLDRSIECERERTAMEGVIHDPVCKKQGVYQTFDPDTTSYVPGEEETLDWSRTDTGRLNRSHELSNAPEGTYTGRIHGVGAEEERGTGKPGGLLQNPGFLERDPNTPIVPGERHHAGNFETKVSDPTDQGGEEMGVTPILHQLDKMNIYDESQQKPRAVDVHLNRTEHTPPVTYETSTYLQAANPGSEGSHDTSQQKQGGYTGKISSAAAVMADKAKQATSSVTSKLGYGGSSDKHPTTVSTGMHEKPSEQMGYGEKISSATAAFTDKAVQAKDVVATKLGYGGTHEGQPPVQEGASNGGSIMGTVKEKMAPVYDKVATVGSTVASKGQGSGTEREVSSSTTGPTTGMDKGVSMKEYLVEKLKPGEEDKALSEVITEALPLHKRREDVSKVGEEGEDGARKVTIIGRVTESEEVAHSLGRCEETNYDDAGTGMASPGKGVMDRIKEAATSWFQKSGEVPSRDTTEGNEGSPRISSKESERKRVGEPGFQ